MTFERTRDPELIAQLIRSAWDRPEMLCEGASLERIPILEHAQYFVVVDGARAVGLVIGIQQSPICLELHVCLTPACRGRAAMAAAKAFFAWLPTATPYRKVIGSLPAYNRPVRHFCRAIGFTVLGVNEKSTMRHGKLEDQIIVERRLA